MKISFDNSFVRQLEGFYSHCKPEHSDRPELIYFNEALAREIHPELLDYDTDQLANIFAGNTLLAGSEPIAQMYAGHQFGRFNPQLGDGRALILGEILDQSNKRVDLCLKGSGRTPYSRGGDGKAALGPMLREVLISEYMHAVGVPTTRSLAVVGTGHLVYRDSPLPGAILTRTAESHIRIGTFEYFAAQGQIDQVRQLADYTIWRHFPELQASSDKYLALLEKVIDRQASLVAKWMGLGFIHGVMNTDNMSICGETIDYGPCAFMDNYNPDTVFSSIDHYGRYAYKNQPAIAQWNLARFAECLLPLIHEDQEVSKKRATETVQSYTNIFQQYWFKEYCRKLALPMEPACDPAAGPGYNSNHNSLIVDWLALLEKYNTDYTLAFQALGDAALNHDDKVLALFEEGADISSWLQRWRDAFSKEALQQAISHHNPDIIPRNHHVEHALDSATHGDLSDFNELLTALQNPFRGQRSHARFKVPASADWTASFQTFCGT